MARYKLRFKRSVAKDLRSIPNKDVQRILKRIEQLADDPRGVGCSKLSGQQVYRVRVAAYRVVYEIIDDVLLIQIIRVAHRARVYR
jgi:mRNA interferase RelE/StbE